MIQKIKTTIWKTAKKLGKEESLGRAWHSFKEKKQAARQTTKHAIGKIARKLHMERFLRRTWDLYKIYIFERVQIHTYDPALNCRATYLFGHRIDLRMKKNENAGSVPGKKAFYFKINRRAEYTLMCIQHWVNIVQHFDANFYFVCDNKYLERDIVRHVYFRNGNINFLPSRNREIRKLAEDLWTGPWELATYAHLVPFCHAKEHGIRQYWAIDGDDTMFQLYPPRVAEILKKVETMADEEHLFAASLDMWRSRSKGRHWSLGVLYINDYVDLCHYFEETNDLSWTVGLDEVVYNLDCYFNYLKDTKKLRIETFYVENGYFIHWGYMMREIIKCSICHWRKGRLIFPIIKYIYQNEELGNIPIADCRKIDIGATPEEGLDFMNRELADTALIRDLVRW